MHPTSSVSGWTIPHLSDSCTEFLCLFRNTTYPLLHYHWPCSSVLKQSEGGLAETHLHGVQKEYPTAESYIHETIGKVNHARTVVIGITDRKTPNTTQSTKRQELIYAFLWCYVK